MTIKWRNNGTSALFQIDVPSDLHGAWGRKQETKKLGKVSENEANKLEIILKHDFNQRFEKKRRELRGETTLSFEDARFYAKKAVNEFRREMRGDGGEDIDISSPVLDELKIELMKLTTLSDDAKRHIKVIGEFNANDINLISRYISEQYELILLREISVAAGFTKSGKEFSIAAAMPAQTVESSNEWHSEFAAKSTKPDINLNMENMGRANKKLTLYQTCEMLKKSNWWVELPPKTKANYEPSFDLICGLLGKEREVHTISPEDIVWLHKMYDNIPMYLNKRLDIRKVIEENMRLIEKDSSNAKEIIASATKNKLRTIPMQLFTELKRLWYIRDNVFAENFPAWSNSDPKTKRVQYTDGELNAIYERMLQEGKNSEMFWIPFIAMHTGARRNELCQLTPEDVTEYNGVWVFKIIEDKENKKTAKTKASTRMVPIHSNIFKAGFHKFLAQNKNNKNGRIWGELSLNANGWGDSFGKKYARMVDGLYSEEAGKEKVFHSYRHTVKARLILEVNKEYVDAIVGWSSDERAAFEQVKTRKKQTSDGYGTDYHIKELQEAIEHLKYDWLSL